MAFLRASYEHSLIRPVFFHVQPLSFNLLYACNHFQKLLLDWRHRFSAESHYVTVNIHGPGTDVELFLSLVWTEQLYLDCSHFGNWTFFLLNSKILKKKSRTHLGKLEKCLCVVYLSPKKVVEGTHTHTWWRFFYRRTQEAYSVQWADGHGILNKRLFAIEIALLIKYYLLLRAQ